MLIKKPKSKGRPRNRPDSERVKEACSEFIRDPTVETLLRIKTALPSDGVLAERNMCKLFQSKKFNNHNCKEVNCPLFEDAARQSSYGDYCDFLFVTEISAAEIMELWDNRSGDFLLSLIKFIEIMEAEKNEKPKRRIKCQ